MKHTKKSKLPTALLAGAGFLFASVAAHAATLAVTINSIGTPTLNGGNWAAGWQFTVTESISVTQLGRFDYESNGINGIVGADVALYEGSTMIASADLSAATVDLSGAYDSYYSAITPVTLTTGNTYTIVAVNTGENIFWDNDNVATYGTGINRIRGIASSGASLPATWTSNSPAIGDNYGYLGGTFKFEAVPEPSSLVLVGFAGFAMLARRRRS